MTKRFFTSYYAKNGRDAKAVSISAKWPHYFRGRWYPKLAPSWDMINGRKHGSMSEREYVEAYLHLLTRVRKLDPFEVVNDLEDGSILLCYETPTDFCHRHIAAEWLNLHTGVEINEWHDPPKHEDLLLW